MIRYWHNAEVNNKRVSQFNTSPPPYDKGILTQERETLDAKIIEYRKLLNDNTSSSETIKERIEYIKVMCRNIITAELNEYVATNGKSI